MKNLFFSENVLISKEKNAIYKAGIYTTGKYEYELLNDLIIENYTNKNAIKMKDTFIWKQEKLEEELSLGTDIFISKETLNLSYKKKEYNIQTPINYISSELGVGTTENGGQEIKNYFEKELFDYPKPSTLIEYLLHIYSNKLDKNDYILDFFSGSGTTSEGVMKYNVKNKCDLKTILIQIEENLYEENYRKGEFKKKNAYEVTLKLKEPPFVTTIGKERIRRAAKKIREDNEKLLESEKTKEDYKDLSNIDFGFKVYKTVTAIETNYFENLEKLEVGSQVELLNNNLSKEDIESLLLTWKLYDGIEFNKGFEKVKFDDYIGYSANNKLYLMDKGFDNNKVKLLLEKIDDVSTFNVRKIILFAVNFNSKELMEIEEAVKGYKNKKEI